MSELTQENINNMQSDIDQLVAVLDRTNLMIGALLGHINHNVVPDDMSQQAQALEHQVQTNKKLLEKFNR